MRQSPEPGLVLEVKHTGERLVLYRARNRSGVEEVHLAGSLPPHREGPPLHVHTLEDEEGEVLSGTLSVMLDGRTLTIGQGGSARFPKGSAHRWWNAGDEVLTFRGVVTPAVDLDRFLHALFEVVNAGPAGRPPLFYLAHALHRHRRTQTALVMPPLLQALIFPVVILVGKLLGKYQGTSWPGCPSRCTGAPLRPGPES